MKKEVCSIAAALVVGLMFLCSYGQIIMDKGLPVWRAVLPSLIVAVVNMDSSHWCN